MPPFCLQPMSQPPRKLWSTDLSDLRRAGFRPSFLFKKTHNLFKFSENLWTFSALMKSIIENTFWWTTRRVSSFSVIKTILSGDHFLFKQRFLVVDQIHSPNAYVRDFYFFSRSQHPQLSLAHMAPDHAYNALQRQAFILKFLESGKGKFFILLNGR